MTVAHTSPPPRQSSLVMDVFAVRKPSQSLFDQSQSGQKIHNNVPLTKASQLLNDGRQSAVGHTLQLAGDAIRKRSTTEVAWLDVPLHQGHLGSESRRSSPWIKQGENRNLISTVPLMDLVLYRVLTPTSPK